MPERIFIGVAWPYANGPAHLGHLAGSYLPADIFARYHRMRGNDVLMVSGSDSHGAPITMRADAEGISPPAPSLIATTPPSSTLGNDSASRSICSHPR